MSILARSGLSLRDWNQLTRANFKLEREACRLRTRFGRVGALRRPDTAARRPHHRTRKNGGDHLRSPPLFSPTEARLFLHRFVQSLHGVAHVLMGFLQVVEFLLLVRR